MGLGKWMAGNAEKASYVTSISVGMMTLVGGILVAMIFYELPFSFLTVQISALGVQSNNPIGADIFTICFVVSGVLFCLHAAYYYKLFRPDVKIVSGASAAFIFMSGVGTLLVGIVPPDVNYPIHIGAAIAAIGGTYMSGLLSLLPVGKKLARKAEWPRPGHVLVLYGALCAIALATIILVGIPVGTGFLAGTFQRGNFPAVWPLCEWLLLSCSMFWSCGIVYTAPKQLEI